MVVWTTLCYHDGCDPLIFYRTRVLEDHPDRLADLPKIAPPVTGDIDPVDQDTARHGLLQEIDHAQQRAFAGAAGAHNAEHITFVDLKAGVIHRPERALSAAEFN